MNKTIVYEHPETICFDLDEDSRKVKVDQFLDWIYHYYGEEMYDFFRMNYDGILENKLPREYDGFCAGTRLSKVLMKKFDVGAEDVRQKLSMLIQSNKVSGKLCLSVHPLDFLSASENNHSWRSCHALDGEYRVGNVSYMMDDCTFIAYLKSDAPDTKLPHFPEDVPWNDKKWRCYFYVDRKNQMIYAARQYPFFSQKALDLVAEIIRTKFGFFWSEDYKNDLLREANRSRFYWDPDEKPKNMDWDYYASRYMHQPTFEPVGLKGDVVINGRTWSFDNTKIIVGYGSNRRIVPVTNYIETDRDACCYNDVIQSHTYAPWIMDYSADDEWTIPVHVVEKLIVGKGVPCVCCGRHNTADSDIFVCNYCRTDERECDRCGCCDRADYMHYDDRTGNWYCDDCYAELYDT